MNQFLKPFFLCLFAFVTSCNVLEQNPISDITLDKAFEGESDMQAAVVGGLQPAGDGNHRRIAGDAAPVPVQRRIPGRQLHLVAGGHLPGRPAG